MFNVFLLVGFFALVGAFSLGFKLARLLRERRKSRALDYLRDTGFYPPIYTGYRQQPQPDTQPQPQTRNSGAIVDQLLYIGIVLSLLYTVFVGLT